MKCVICHESIQHQRTWLTAIIPEKRKYICSNCENSFDRIEAPFCEKCGRPSQQKNCRSCDILARRFPVRPLRKSRSVYTYNQFMKEVIANLKYRGDYMIVNAFAHIFQKAFIYHYKELINNAIITPIPLSTKRLHERRFNQAYALAQLLNTNEIKCLLKRQHSEKQSKKSLNERLQTENPFIINTANSIEQPVILIDDIYTTGMTLHQAATVLLKRGCPSVYAFTLVRG